MRAQGDGRRHDLVFTDRVLVTLVVLRLAEGAGWDNEYPAASGACAAWASTLIRAGALAAKVPARRWHRMSAGPGSRGERLHDWALAPAC